MLTLPLLLACLLVFFGLMVELVKETCWQRLKTKLAMAFFFALVDQESPSDDSLSFNHCMHCHELLSSMWPSVQWGGSTKVHTGRMVDNCISHLLFCIADWFLPPFVHHMANFPMRWSVKTQNTSCKWTKTLQMSKWTFFVTKHRPDHVAMKTHHVDQVTMVHVCNKRQSNRHCNSWRRHLTRMRMHFWRCDGTIVVFVDTFVLWFFPCWLTSPTSCAPTSLGPRAEMHFELVAMGFLFG